MKADKTTAGGNKQQNPGGANADKNKEQDFFSTHMVQPKLTIGPPNDPYEQEADAMAERVVNNESLINAGSKLASGIAQPKLKTRHQVRSKPQLLQQQEGEEMEEPMQAKPLQRAAEEEMEEPLQTRLDLQRKAEEEEMLQEKSTVQRAQAENPVASPELEAKLNSKKGSGRPLPGETNQKMSRAFGADFSHVQVHTGSDAVQMNQELQARAFTRGSDIYFNRGEYDTQSQDGKRLLAHELTHVVQQGGGVNRKIKKKSGESIQKFAQAAAAAPILGLTAEAWGVAANVVGIITAAGSAAAGTYQAVSRGENAFGSLNLPHNLMSEQDKRKLRQIAQFRIINEYVRRFMERPENQGARDSLQGGGGSSGQATPPAGAPGTGNQASSPTPTTEPSAPEQPTGTPTSAQVNQEVLDAVKNAVQIELQTALERATSTKEYEFRWGEDDSRGEGAIGSSEASEDVGVTGYLQFQGIQASMISETLTLSELAKAALGSVPGDGTAVVVHKLMGGNVSGEATWSAWDNLTVNVEGGSAQQSVHENGSIKLIIRTHWYWERWGPDSDSWMENTIHIDDEGKVIIAEESRRWRRD